MLEVEILTAIAVDIEDDRLLHINQIVQTVAEHHLVAPAPGPRRGGIAR